MDTTFLNTLNMKNLRKYAELISLKQNNPNKAGQRYLTSNKKIVLINKISHGLNNLVSNYTQINGPNGTIFYLNANKLGQGTFGTVYKGYYKPTNGALIPAAIKKSKRNANDLVIQNQNLHKIKNVGIADNFLQVYDLINKNNNSYLAIELLDNYMDLSEALHKKYILKQSVFEEISNQLMNSVSLLHTNNFVHTDLKPSNFMVQVNRQKKQILPKIKIIDLGSLIQEKSNIHNYRFHSVTYAYVKPTIGKSNQIFRKSYSFSQMKENDRYATIYSIYRIMLLAGLSMRFSLLSKIMSFSPELLSYIARWSITYP